MSLLKIFLLNILIVILTINCGYPNTNSYNVTPDSQYVGIWQGVLNISETRLRIVFHISKVTDSLKASLDSPDQGAFGIPVSSISLSEDSIRLNIQAVNGYYIGKYESDSLKLTGEWNQNGMSLPLDLKKSNKVEEAKRLQEPKKPYPYKEEEIKIENKEAGITLAGTLTLPESGSEFPAVVLITGSGPQDRNETIMNHKPFLVLADYLTKKGIAVLRYDDRGFGESGGDFKTATTEDFVTDVLSAVDYLQTRKEINPEKIGLIGHSEGGLVAPLAAVNSDKIDFIVLMAGPGLTGEEILKMQTKLIMKANGLSDSFIQKSLELNEKSYKLIKTEKDSVELRKKLNNLFDDYINNLPEEDRQKLGNNPKSIFESQMNFITSPWFKFFLTYDPQPTLQKVKVPVLAINGSKDLQVPPKEDLSAISEALKKGGNKNYKVEELEGLNHLFQTAKTGTLSEYSQIEETISPKALELIGKWILGITKQ